MRCLLVDFCKLKAQSKLIPDFFSPLVQSGKYLHAVLDGTLFAPTEINPTHFPLQRAPEDRKLRQQLLYAILMSHKENEGG